MIHRLSFRKSAVALTTAGVLAVSASLPFTAAAETIKPIAATNGGVTSTTDCSTYRPDMAFGETECEALRGKALKAEGKALDVELAKSQQNLACLRKIKIFFDAGRVSRERIVEYGKRPRL